MEDVFDTLVHLDVNEHVEQKNTGKATLSYLSWPWAWQEIRKRYPDVRYEILKNDQGLPYFEDPRLGIMVYTTVTIGDETRMMWLPVMDGANNAMRMEPYEVPTRFGPKQVPAATMFDINKTVMRCLVKNFAMFGLGLYIFAGEDLPEETDESKALKAQEAAQKAAEIKELVESVAREAEPIVKSMTMEEKQAFVQNVIVPVIGVPNYKACKDAEKLRGLLSKVRNYKKEAA